MNNSALESLIDTMNAQIQSLNKNNFKVYDAENPEFFITGVEYDSESDILIFKCSEDGKKE